MAKVGHGEEGEPWPPMPSTTGHAQMRVALFSESGDMDGEAGRREEGEFSQDPEGW